MVESIIDLDKELLVFLNNLGATPFDEFWAFITRQTNWIPFFIGVLFVLKRAISWKNLFVIIIMVAVLILFTDQTTNLFKFHFIRLRPCNDPEIMSSLRFIHCSSTFSFFSGHASSSMASMLFLFLILRKYYKYAFLVFIFPLVFAYSRIYLALHFPLDIFCGYLFGIFSGTTFYLLYHFLNKKYAFEKL
jgi:undecaprenyl-diphosphatase